MTVRNYAVLIVAIVVGMMLSWAAEITRPLSGFGIACIRFLGFGIALPWLKRKTADKSSTGPF